MNWEKFLEAVGAFFTAVGSIFLTGIKAAIPVAEQAVFNFLKDLVEQVVAGIATGAIPLPFGAGEIAEGHVFDQVTFNNARRDLAFQEVRKRLANMNIPEGMVIKDSMIYWTIETQYQKYLAENSGNHGNFPGGNSGPVS